ncbi:MAG TPA: hypothetical protein VM935_14700, partial [Chitinophagaceae bacterium]|nr:hypothetical protein [Chitinophagaceae bacterium]
MTYPISNPSGTVGFYHFLFDALSGTGILFRNDPPRYTIEAVTPHYLKEANTAKGAFIGKGVSEVYPSFPDDPWGKNLEELISTFNHVQEVKETCNLPVRRYEYRNEDG